MVQSYSLLWSKHIDTHMGTGGVVEVQEALVPGIQLQVVLRWFFQPEEAFLFIGAKAALDHRILIGRTLVDVEVLKAELRTLGVKALLKLQPIVRLDIVQQWTGAPPLANARSPGVAALGSPNA